MEISKIGSIAMYAQMRKPKEPKKPKQAVSKFHENAHMSTIYSATGFEFAWLSKKGNQVTPFASCRDYLQGSAWCAYTGLPLKVHSLYFNPDERHKIDLNNIRIVVRYRDVGNESFKKFCEGSLSLLNEVEKEMGIPKSVLKYGGLFKSPVEGSIQTNYDTWVFIGNKSWMRSIYHMSMYSLLIRAGALFNGGPWRRHLKGGLEKFIVSKDRLYLEQAMKGIEAIVSDKEHTLFAKLAKDNFPLDIANIFLANEGIKAFSLNSVNSKLKVNWQDKEFKF